MNIPYFPFYPQDWLADPKVQQLSFEEQGVYFSLLCHMWEFADNTCSLPDDAEFMCRLLKVRPAKWRKLRAVLVDGVGAVIQSREGRLVNRRLLKEYAKAKEKSQNAAAAAKKKWTSPRENQGTQTAPNQETASAVAQRTHSERTALAMRTQCQAEAEADTDTDPDSDKDLTAADASARAHAREDLGDDGPAVRRVTEHYCRLVGRATASNKDLVAITKAVEQARGHPELITRTLSDVMKRRRRAGEKGHVSSFSYFVPAIEEALGESEIAANAETGEEGSDVGGGGQADRLTAGFEGHFR